MIFRRLTVSPVRRVSASQPSEIGVVLIHSRES